MNNDVVAVVEQMGTTTVAFMGDVVSELWPLFLSLGVLAFAGAFILRKTGMGRS